MIAPITPAMITCAGGALADAEKRPEDGLRHVERARLARLVVQLGHRTHPFAPCLPSTWKNVYDIVT
jgi:hypothetical protein